MEFSRGLDPTHDSELLPLPVSIENPWKVAMAENDPSPHHHAGVGNLGKNGSERLYPELSENSAIVFNNSFAPRVNRHFSTVFLRGGHIVTFWGKFSEKRRSG